MAVNFVSCLDESVMVELAETKDENLEAGMKRDDGHTALLFNMIRDRYDSPSNEDDE